MLQVNGLSELCSNYFIKRIDDDYKSMDKVKNHLELKIK